MKNTLYFILFFLTVHGQAQESPESLRSQFDSLLELKDDLIKVRSLNDLGFQSKYIDYSLTEDIIKESYRISKQNNYHSECGNALKLAGIMDDEHGRYKQAIDNYLLAIQEFKLDNDSIGVAKCEANIGIIYQHIKESEKSFTYFYSSLAVFKKYGFKPGESAIYEAIGVSHMHLGNSDSALYYFQMAYAENQSSGKIDPGLEMNIGLVYMNIGQSEKSEKYLLHSMELFEKYDPHNNNLSTLYQNLGALKNAKGSFHESIVLCKKAMDITGDNIYTREYTYVLNTIARAYYRTGQYKEAAENYSLLNRVKDSIYSADNIELLTEMTEKYESEKKELEIASLNKEKNLEQIKRKREEEKVQYFTIGGGLISILLIWVVYSLTQKSRDNKRIKEKNEEIELQRSILSEKNNEILASITYAQRIQGAILPAFERISPGFKDLFISYIPKDIVAGDFYWYEVTEDEHWVAVADCTGHGVPGALVSVVCHNALNRAVREFKLKVPGDILNKVRDLVTEQFTQSQLDVKDGMDIALCHIKDGKLSFSGAHNPLWLIRKNELIEYKGDKQPVGLFEMAKSFTTVNVDIQTGDRFYIFSDGFVDQFGGENGKKFKTQRFKELLLKLHQKNLIKQKEIIESQFDSWKGKLEQVDDVCIIGFEV